MASINTGHTNGLGRRDLVEVEPAESGTYAFPYDRHDGRVGATSTLRPAYC